MGPSNDDNPGTMMSGSERDLVLAMLAGDERAFTEFFDGYFPGIFRFALRRLGRDEDAAEEVAQATLCTAIGKLSTYRGEAALFTWLCTFCRHEISAHFTRRGRDRAVVSLVEDDPEIAAALDSLAASAGGGPEAAIARDETARLVHVLLDRLPPRYAAVLEWKYIDGLPVKAIATLTRQNEKAVESLLTRAREAFREGFAVIARNSAAGERT